ncbi:MAG: DUF1501 domain-containing protein [Planctomycetaceae bacterium]
MLTIFGKPPEQCDGLTRRHFLTAGSLGAGLTLADLLRAEDGRGATRKAIINVHLDGGPPHMDMIDLKPGAPVEIRGEFSPISTSLPGFHLCEHLPRLATIADKFVWIRSLVGSASRHDAFQCMSGFDLQDLQSLGGRPAMGSIVARLTSSTSDATPAFVDLMQGRPLVRNSARPGFLGPAFQPFRPDISAMFERPLEPRMIQELAALGADHSIKLTLDPGLTAARLHERTRLLASHDALRRTIDASGMTDAMDRFTQQAVSILTSGKFADALDLEKEDPRVLRRYTPPADDPTQRFDTAEDPRAARKFLLARRLVEAGVRVVTLSLSDFDTHSENFPRLRQVLPILDCGLHALVTDLEERGMLDDVTIVAWGEFGRTPRIDDKSQGGRHHWPQVGPAFLAGGGLRVGQVIGATDRLASEVAARPVQYQDILATLYWNLGINATATTLQDPTGRPQYLLDRGAPIREMV